MSSFSLRNNDSDLGPLYFLHIPKTAGTAFTEFLRFNHTKDATLQAQTWNLLYEHLYRTDISYSELLPYVSSHQLITGHFGYGIALQMDVKPRIFTILRNPIERTISQLCHVRKHPTYNFWTGVRFWREDNIDEVVNDPLRISFFSNYQSRYIAADFDYPTIVEASGFDGADLFFDSSHAFRYMNTENLFEKASINAETFSLVGIQDYLEETMLLLSARIGLKPISAVTKLGMQQSTDISQKQRLTNEHYKILMEINDVDVRIYNHFKQKFETEYLKLVHECTGNSISSWDNFIKNKQKINKKIRTYITQNISL